MTWNLQTDHERLEITDAEQLRRRLEEWQRSARERPIVVTLDAPDGSCLAIGLGHDLSALNRIAPGGWPAQHVVGDESFQGVLDYMCCGESSEVLAKHAIPIDVAIDAAVEFFTSAELDDKLQWEAD